VSDFIRCVSEHEKVRTNSSRSLFYWVCAYANNQHELGKDLANDPKTTSFYQAMTLSVGVLLILDEEATPFKRIWCCYEESVAVTNFDEERKVKDPMLLDIATLDAGSCTVLTQGLTCLDVEHEKAVFAFGAGWRHKTARDDKFPLSVVKPVLRLDIRAAEASQAIDKNRILNSLAHLPKKDLDKEPNTNRKEYDNINRKLRGIFAVAVWRQAVMKKDISSPDSELNLAHVLEQDVERDTLEICFDHLGNLEDKHLAVLGRNLPAGLRVLKISCQQCWGLKSIDA